MNAGTLLAQPFFQITLPIVLTIFIATWAQNRRIDDLARRLDRVERIIEEILKTLVGIEHRLTVLEERNSPFSRR